MVEQRANGTQKEEKKRRRFRRNMSLNNGFFRRRTISELINALSEVNLKSAPDLPVSERVWNGDEGPDFGLV